VVFVLVYLFAAVVGLSMEGLDSSPDLLDWQMTWDAIVAVEFALAGPACLKQADLVVDVGIDAAALVGMACLAPMNMIVVADQHVEYGPVYTPIAVVDLETLLILVVRVLDAVALAAQEDIPTVAEIQGGLPL
jgi:hypothetical protein